MKKVLKGRILISVCDFIATLCVFAMLVTLAVIAAMHGYKSCRDTGATYQECMR